MWKIGLLWLVKKICMKNLEKLKEIINRTYLINFTYFFSCQQRGTSYWQQGHVLLQHCNGASGWRTRSASQPTNIPVGSNLGNSNTRGKGEVPDEAGCYHNNAMIASLKDVGKRLGIEVKSYDYSEPAYGKDVCDRILCPMKTSIRSYCNEGHGIATATDMRTALLERPVRGVK